LSAIVFALKMTNAAQENGTWQYDELLELLDKKREAIELEVGTFPTQFQNLPYSLPSSTITGKSISAMAPKSYFPSSGQTSGEIKKRARRNKKLVFLKKYKERTEK
jgi:hypothetical protein